MKGKGKGGNITINEEKWPQENIRRWGGILTVKGGAGDVDIEEFKGTRVLSCPRREGKKKKSSGGTRKFPH